MESFEALGLCIGRDTRDIARAVGKEPITVNKWKADPLGGSGSRNPLDLVRIMIEGALDLGRDPKEALAPIRYLQECFRERVEAQTGSVHEEFCDLISEVSHLMSEHSEAVSDGRISANERRRIEKEGQHLKSQLDSYLAKVRDVSGEN